MATIKCPKCGEVFTVDESSYAQILKQVRDEELKREVAERLELSLKAQEIEQKLALEKQSQDLEAQIAELKAELKAANARRESELKELMLRNGSEVEKLRRELENADQAKELALSKAELEWKEKLSTAEKDREVLKDSLVQEKEQAKNREQFLIEQITTLKEMKKRLSTKMLGESLEQHCKAEFEKIRSAAYPHAYFEKDNDASEGTKGDFIFRNYLPEEVNGEKVELVSIMFEMKNEDEGTGRKHKNEEFFAKLDKDRREKGCEYAVLVSMLEDGNELYDQGIVDVSHKFPKMFVIRPQFFLPLIGILDGAAKKNAESKRELELVKAQNVDLTNFEGKLQAAREKVERDYHYADTNFHDAIAEIDKSIQDLQKVKQKLLTSFGFIKKADAVMEDLTIRKLTYGNKTVQALLEAQKGETSESDPQEIEIDADPEEGSGPEAQDPETLL
ncbi:DUF2130 domain-containing protein [bacterium]|nr:DUF2130 domain-containing protein [bacterium]